MFRLASHLHQVPVLLTPNKPYGIARNDVMMSAEHCEVADVFNSTLHGYSTPLAGRELSVEELGGSLLHSPELSNVCKKVNMARIFLYITPWFLPWLLTFAISLIPSIFGLGEVAWILRTFGVALRFWYCYLPPPSLVPVRPFLLVEKDSWCKELIQTRKISL